MAKRAKRWHRLTVRLDGKMYREVKRSAKHNEQSVAEWIRGIIHAELSEDDAHYHSLIEKHRNDPAVPVEEVLARWKKEGVI
ncbi:MAG: hypothetical protein IT371_20720 [Deltaproteobacteria bacterium]|nr:hypothetical protein [Deltaproteobacteria bacterium]